MSSLIRTMYSNLAARNVTYTNQHGVITTPRTYDLDELPDNVSPADAPARLLLPYATFTEGKDGRFAALGAISQINWSITDLLLITPGVLGGGIGQVAADIVLYQDAYVTMLTRGDRTLDTGGEVEVLGWRPIPGLYDWPIGSGQWWQGVMIVIDVLEVIQ